jgi:hypothetical protein
MKIIKKKIKKDKKIFLINLILNLYFKRSDKIRNLKKIQKIFFFKKINFYVINISLFHAKFKKEFNSKKNTI